jgi:hypothetical protein
MSDLLIRASRDCDHSPLIHVSMYTATYTQAVADAMIRVPAEVRDRLAVVAESRGMSIRALIQEFAESTLTADELRERAERTRGYLAEHFGFDISDEESAAMGARVREAFAKLGGAAR